MFIVSIFNDTCFTHDTPFSTNGLRKKTEYEIKYADSPILWIVWTFFRHHHTCDLLKFNQFLKCCNWNATNTFTNGTTACVAHKIIFSCSIRSIYISIIKWCVYNFMCLFDCEIVSEYAMHSLRRSELIQFL